MERRKEVTLDELLKKTKKLAKPRPSCVLEGKEKMRGPGVNDPDDFKIKEVCKDCGSTVLGADLRTCSICYQGCHTLCLKLPVNAPLGLDGLCSRCTSSQLDLANEASPSSCPMGGQDAMTCNLDFKLDKQSKFSTGMIVSVSDNNSCRENKPIASLDESVKLVDHSEKAWMDIAEGAGCAVLEEARKSCHAQEESDEQLLAPEGVRRSKRGRPYKPAGGLHPNKRRNVDSSRNTDRVIQGRIRPVVEEEDELGAKIEKFRVISSIDEKNSSKRASSKDDVKGSISGRAFGSEEGEEDVQEETSGEVDDGKRTKSSGGSACNLEKNPTDLVISPIVGDRENLEDYPKFNGVSCEIRSEFILATGGTSAGQMNGVNVEETLKTKDSASEIPFTERLISVSNSGGGCSAELRSLDDPKKSQESRSTETMVLGCNQEESEDAITETSVSLSKSSMSLICGAEKHPQNLRFLSDKDPSGSELKNRVRETDPEPGEVVVGLPGFRIGHKTSSREMSKEVAVDTACSLVFDKQSRFSSVQSTLSDLSIVNPLYSSSAPMCNLVSPPSQCLPASVLSERSPLVGVSPMVGLNPAVASATDGGSTGMFSAVLKAAPSSTDVAIPILIITEQETKANTDRMPESFVGGTLGDSLLPTLSSMPQDGKRDLTCVAPPELAVVNNTMPSRCLQPGFDSGIASPCEQGGKRALMDDQAAASQYPSVSVKNNLLKLVSNCLESDLKLAEEEEDGVAPPVLSTLISNCLESDLKLIERKEARIVPPVSAATVNMSTIQDGLTDMVCQEKEPDMRKNSTSGEEELGCRGSQSVSLEEDDDVKVCDICGDAGYEECLAVCSACNEGAEHIYCMQALLHAVPENGWLCEGCKLKEKGSIIKQVEDHPSSQVHSPLLFPSPKKKQTIKGNIRDRLSARLDKGKASSQQRKGATKGIPSHQVSTKRPSDGNGTAPAKKQILESSGVPSPVASALAARALTRDSSFKIPDAGKVKYLSPNTLATPSAGVGIRSSGKSPGFVGNWSQSPRPGLSPVPQIAGKHRNALAGDLPVGLSSVAAKQIPCIPRPSSLYIVPGSSPAGRVSGSWKSNETTPSFLLPSRSGGFRGVAASKLSKEGSIESNGLQSSCRDGLLCHIGGGNGEGRNAVVSGKTLTNCVDTPRQSTESFSPGIQPLDSTRITSKAFVPQKSLQMSDSGKSRNNLARSASFNRVPLTQSTRDEAKVSQELQCSRGSRTDFKLMDTSSALTSRLTSALKVPTISSHLSLDDSQNVEAVQGLSEKIQETVDFSKGQLLHHPGTVAADGQKTVYGVLRNGSSANEDLGGVSISSTKALARKEVVLNEVPNNTPKDFPSKAKDLKLKDIPEIGWSSSKHVGSGGTTRCYKCKEMGHSAQSCSSRSTATTRPADLVASNIIKSPRECSGGPSLCKSSGLRVSDNSSVDIALPSSLQETGSVGTVPVSEPMSDFRQRMSKGLLSPSGHTPMNVVDDLKKQVLTVMSPSQVGGPGNQTGQPAAFVTLGRLPSVMVAPERLSSGRGTSLPTDTHWQPATPMLQSGVKPVAAISSENMESLEVRDLTVFEVSKEGRRSDNAETTIQEGSSKLGSVGGQTSCGDVISMPRSGILPTYVVGHALEASLPTPMIVIQSKGSSPWGQVAPPRLVSGGDKVVNQEARGMRLGVGIPHGIGMPSTNALVSLKVSAVPEAQCLWSGGFEVVSATAPAFYDGLQAYSSSFAAPKVRIVTKTLPPRLQLEEVRRMFNGDAWPKQFQQKPPTDKEIALYFFVGNESFERGYARLLEHMMVNDLVLMGQVEGAEILIFPSHLLPAEYHRWKNKMFLWGVYRAKKSNPVITSANLDSSQNPSNSLVHACSNILVTGRPEILPKLATLPKLPSRVITSGGDAGEVDMEIDTVSVDAPCRPIRRSGWDEPAASVSPPLPSEPAPIQPPPPAPMAASPDEQRITRYTSSMEMIPEDRGSAHLDLPPGFGPIPQKHMPLRSGQSDTGGAQIVLSGLGPTCGPPGFAKLSDVVGTVQTQAADDVLGSNVDTDKDVLPTKLQSIRDGNVGEGPALVPSTSQASPLPDSSPKPRDARDNLGLKTSHVSKHRLSCSRSRSPKRSKDNLNDQSGGRASSYAAGRRKDRVGERDREMRREKEDRGRERQRDREREREKERSIVRDRHKNRDHRHKDRGRSGDYKYRRYDRSRSKSQSCSRCHSVSRRRVQSPSISPKRRRSSGKCLSRHRSRSYSDSPDSDRGRPWRKVISTERYAESRAHSQSGTSTVRRVVPCSEGSGRHGRTAREARVGEASPESRLTLSDKEDSVPTFAVVRRGEVLKFDEQQQSDASLIPFYDIHQPNGEKEGQNCSNERTSRGTVPCYHVFLPGEAGGPHLLEMESGLADYQADQQCLLRCPRASAQSLELLSKSPSSEIFQNHKPWELERAGECSGYQFFPVEAGKVGDVRSNPSLELALGEDKSSAPRVEPVPFFVRLLDTVGGSLEPPNGASIVPSGLTGGLSSVTNTKQETSTSELSSPLNLTLSVPQYRKEGNIWVKIETADSLLGEEDVDFALTL